MVQGAAIAEADAAVGLWMADLVARYAGQRDAQWRPSISTVVAAFLFVGVVAAVVMLHRDRDAYPSDPQKQAALDACSRTDPVFIRFLAADRTACYRRMLSVR